MTRGWRKIITWEKMMCHGGMDMSKSMKRVLVLKILHSERPVLHSGPHTPPPQPRTHSIRQELYQVLRVKMNRTRSLPSRSWQFLLRSHEQMPIISSIWYPVEAQYIFAYLMNIDYMEAIKTTEKAIVQPQDSEKIF